MKKVSIALLLTLMIVFSTFGMASAITDGELDGEGHPYVGLMVAQTADGTPLWRCSGTLIAPRLFLTAGHCTEAPAAHVEIWFDSDVESGIPENGYPYAGDVGGTPYTHPQYDPNAFYLYDLGVVVLDKPVQMDEYGVLPELNQLDGLTKKSTFTAVGYGLQKSFPDAASWRDQDDRVRMVSYPQFMQYFGDIALKLSNNASTGGTCYGDSGGPNFIGDSNVIGGVTSFGNSTGTCSAYGGVYRIDQADDLDWLYGTFGQYLK